MAGPIVGAERITDKTGSRFTPCPLCAGNKCTACGNKGYIPFVPVAVYQMSTFLPTPYTDLERAYLSQISPLFADEDIEPDLEDFPTRPDDADLIPYSL